MFGADPFVETTLTQSTTTSPSSSPLISVPKHKRNVSDTSTFSKYALVIHLFLSIKMLININLNYLLHFCLKKNHSNNLIK